MNNSGSINNNEPSEEDDAKTDKQNGDGHHEETLDSNDAVRFDTLELEF